MVKLKKPEDHSRADKIKELILAELASGILELRDPRIDGAFITRVEVTDDLQLAKVYVRKGMDATEPEKRTLLLGLEAAKGRLRRTLGALGLRYTPNLKFYFDTGVDSMTRVEELLEEIRREGGGSA